MVRRCHELTRISPPFFHISWRVQASPQTVILHRRCAHHASLGSRSWFNGDVSSRSGSAIKPHGQECCYHPQAQARSVLFKRDQRHFLRFTTAQVLRRSGIGQPSDHEWFENHHEWSSEDRSSSEANFQARSRFSKPQESVSNAHGSCGLTRFKRKGSCDKGPALFQGYLRSQ